MPLLLSRIAQGLHNGFPHFVGVSDESLSIWYCVVDRKKGWIVGNIRDLGNCEGYLLLPSDYPHNPWKPNFHANPKNQPWLQQDEDHGYTGLLGFLANMLEKVDLYV